jgi:hypothetical protein
VPLVGERRAVAPRVRSRGPWSAAQVGTYIRALRGRSGRGRRSSTGSGFHMWTNPGICGATPNSCGAICGTRRMSNFLPRTPCAPLRAGHRTLPPINPRPWPKGGSGIRQERRSVPRGNSRRRPGDGVGGVGESGRSRGASPSLLARGPLGAHTIERPSPLLPLWNRPCRFQGGDRVPAGLPEGARVPSRRRFPWGSREPRDAAG